MWKPKYREIVERLDLDEAKDREASKLLGSLLPKMNISGLKEIVEGKECIIFGAGPSLKSDLNRISKAGWLDKGLISADGATKAVFEFAVPDIIVTDLDGYISDQIEAWEKGSWIVIHGHGDNIGKLKRIVPKFSERVIGTTQVDKPSELYNFGGFTDGDRAAFLANELGASKIFLAGMDLGEKIGKYTGKTKKEKKIKKLKICKDLLSWLTEDLDADLVNITKNGENIPGIPRKDL